MIRIEATATGGGVIHDRGNAEKEKDSDALDEEMGEKALVGKGVQDYKKRAG